MNNNYKYLTWAGTGVLLVLGFFLLVMTGHIAGTSTNTNSVSFTGEGKVFAKPDIAAVSFSILTEAKTSTAAQEDNSKKSNKVVEFVKSQNIDDKDIKTTGYNVYPQYNYSTPCPYGVIDCIQRQPQISGYQVTQSFEVKVRDLDKVSAVLDGLVTAGANQVNHLGLQVDDMEKVRNEAREKAIADAKLKATTLKKQIGLRLGKIINYYEGGNGDYPMMYKTEAMSFDGRGGGGVAPAIPVGENEIVITVTLTYQIK